MSIAPLSGFEAKEAARAWLESLNTRLGATLPSPVDMQEQIASIVDKAKATGNKFLHSPEYAFLNGFAVPEISKLIREKDGLSAKLAKEALLSEWWRGMPEYHRKSPARAHGHPFEKTRRDAKAILRRWRGLEVSGSGQHRKPMHQACPDLAIGDPFPHKIVFEAKYFREGENAEIQLVDGIYETFYYLALPSIPATGERPPWHYRYGCFIAFDASDRGDLLSAWNSIPEEARNDFWIGGNIFVMIVRPSASVM